MRILFICKRNEIYGNALTYTRRSSGLYNSTRFIVEGLVPRGVDASIVEVKDNNDIDREVSKFKPDICVIEALWVVPDKYPVLMKLHPKVKWYVHLHSDMPFLALEGVAMEWIVGASKLGVGHIANSKESFDALSPILPADKLVYLPNVYLGKPMHAKLQEKHGAINVACFGAVRPLKNHLLQALAAIQFARDMGKPLRFHINTGRTETGGEPVLKNIRTLFKQTQGAELVEHTWFEPEDLIKFLNEEIDLGLQVSLTETFNVVTADYTVAGLPVVVSNEVKWCPRSSKALNNSLPDIVCHMHHAYQNRKLVKLTQSYLKGHTSDALKLWYEFVKKNTRKGKR